MKPLALTAEDRAALVVGALLEIEGAVAAAFVRQTIATYGSLEAVRHLIRPFVRAGYVDRQTLQMTRAGRVAVGILGRG